MYQTILLQMVAPIRNICLFLLLGCVCPMQAQLHFNADVKSNHLWRGIEVADGVVLTADVNYSLLDGMVNIGLWGGTNATGTYKEFNNHLSLCYRGFSLSFWDTYNFSPGATYNNREFFNYQAHETGRFLDATASYHFGKKFPLLLSWSTVLFGAFALNRSGDSSHFYGDKAGIVHMMLKVTRRVNIGKWKLPIYACALWNPQSDRAFLQIGAQVFSF